MYPHRIRLRGPWELDDTDGSRRVTLPAEWADLDVAPGPATFRRRFGSPSRLDAHERVWLVGDGACGPLAMTLNGHALPLTIDDARFATPISGILAPRNLLEVALVADDRRTGYWSDVALEIRATAYFAGVRRTADGAVEGRVVGEAPGPLDVYLLAGGRSAGYASLSASAEGTPFRVTPESAEKPLRVELVLASAVWYVVELGDAS